LKYQEIKIGTGAEAQPFKVFKVFYTGYRAADGVKFDSSDDHRNPVMGADGKPEMGPDGKPKLGDPEPLAFPQGMGRLIPGFDQGFNGMHVGGKRRLFIPWQLAYGTRSIPEQPAKDNQPAHVGIPAKSDLIFDVELLDVTEMPQQAPHSPMGAAPPPGSAPPAGSSAPATPAPPSQTPPPQPQP
jgi:peptidylprolyl isomerase